MNLHSSATGPVPSSALVPVVVSGVFSPLGSIPTVSGCRCTGEVVGGTHRFYDGRTVLW